MKSFGKVTVLLLAPLLLSILTTLVIGCSYSDACNKRHISADAGSFLTDSCRNVWRVDAHCRLSYFTTTTRWMKSLHSHTFHSLAIPGSHDANAYKTKYPVFLTAKRWALTQDMDIYQQLSAGIRFLDIRLRKEGTIVMTAHRYYMVPFSTVVADINRFVSEQPSEVVGIEMSNDRNSYPHEKLSLHEITTLASTSFGSRMYLGLPTSTLGYLVSHKKNIIVNARRNWYWLNAQYGGQVCTKLRSLTKGSSTLDVIAMAVTPEANTIANGELIGTHDSLKSATAALKPSVLFPYISAQSAPAHSIHSKSNAVYLHDFVDAVTIANVLNLNHASHPAKSFICVRPGCATDSDCPTEAGVCRNAITTTSHKYTCESKRALGAQCSYGSSCASGSCFSVGVGFCQCSPCHGSGCGGCPTSHYCAKTDSISANRCRRWHSGLKNNGHSCGNSGECYSGCCSYTVFGTDTCEEDKVWRRCT